LGVSWKSTGGGLVAIIPAVTPHRVNQDQKYITGHQAQVCDLRFSPFQAGLLATSSEDATVRIWQIEKDGLTQNLSAETQKYSGHSKRVSFSSWSPTVMELIASASFDCSVHVWNILNGAKVWDFSQSENVLSLDWNSLGSLVGCTTKDRLVHVLDPRSKDSGSRLSVQAHDGVKPHKMVFLSNEHIATTGFSKTNERQIKLWDTRNFTKE